MYTIFPGCLLIEIHMHMHTSFPGPLVIEIQTHARANTFTYIIAHAHVVIMILWEQFFTLTFLLGKKRDKNYRDKV